MNKSIVVVWEITYFKGIMVLALADFFFADSIGVKKGVERVNFREGRKSWPEGSNLD